MEKVKSFFEFLLKLIITPLQAIVSIPVSDRFINFMNKHVWLRILISGIIMLIIVFFVHFKELIF